MRAIKNTVRRIGASPAALLFLLAPAVGELLSSSSPLPGFIVAWLPLAVLYGCGALLVREARVRFGLGWPAVFLLGAAYGIVEEGIVVRSFFDPGWVDLGLLAEYGRAGGVNWTWSHLLTLFHSAVSIAVPIAAVELWFADRRHQSWIERRGLVWCSLGILGWGLVGDAGFMDATAGQLLGATLVVVALTAVALRFEAAHVAAAAVVEPHPRRYYWLSFITGFVTFVIPHLASENPQVHALWPSIGMTVVPVTAVFVWARWSQRGMAWTDRDRAGMIGGVVGFLAVLVAPTGSPVAAATSVVSVWLWWRWSRAIAERTERAVAV